MGFIAGMSTNLKLSSRATTILISGIGIGAIIFGLLLRRWLRNNDLLIKQSLKLNADGVHNVATDGYQQLDRTETVRASSRLRCTPSLSERGSLRQGGGSRQRNHFSSNVDMAAVGVIDTTQELLRCLERSVNVIETYRNLSDKHSSLFEEFTSIADRLKTLESDVAHLVAQGALEEFRDEISSVVPQSAGWSVYNGPRAGTLSVLSDDSFMSAYEEFVVTLDDDILRDVLSIPDGQLHFYKDGLRAANHGEVNYRKMRGDVCQCESELDFAAKLWCLRKAFQLCLNDEHRRMWIAKAGRTLLGDILKHSKQDPTQFYTAFDALIEFFRNEANVCQMEEELAGRGVVDFGFWDIVLDFILLDSFDDIKSPPSAVYSVTKNYFLSNSIKYSTIRTIIWSMLKAKRQRLKEQVTQFVVDIFSLKRVRYTTVEALAEDVWIILESRAEAFGILYRGRCYTTLLSRYVITELDHSGMTFENTTSNGDLLEKISLIDEQMRNTCDLIPISIWGFDGSIHEKLRLRKHRIVNQKLTPEEKQALSKSKKQRIARTTGAVYRRVSEDASRSNIRADSGCKSVEKNDEPQNLPSRTFVKLDKPNNSTANSGEMIGVPINSSNPIAEEFENRFTGDGKKRHCDRLVEWNGRSKNLEYIEVSSEAEIGDLDIFKQREVALRKLQEKLKMMKAHREGKTKTNKEFSAVLKQEERRKLKRRISKMKMKQRRAKEKQQNIDISNDTITNSKTEQLEDGMVSFSNFDFIVKGGRKKRRLTTSERKQKFSGKDYRSLIKKVEKREQKLERLREKEPEKAVNMENSIKWNRVFNKARGIKDNVQFLQKGLKRKEKLKERRKEEWLKRTANVLREKEKKQDKRRENILKRMEDKKKRKIKLLKRKGRIL
ncbi:surfeit locus protein 6 [Dictyocaulus viviparus]|uniref:Surfeit locus protein 6 n=1 Tax=Dictyocaulus viviparus TaxID=29172 RepID=A0A0D8XYV7_DICVI|nr:surfeit locus protein 6 [Dictyocaulus viviparus]